MSEIRIRRCPIDGAFLLTSNTHRKTLTNFSLLLIFMRTSMRFDALTIRLIAGKVFNYVIIVDNISCVIKFIK